LSAKDKLKIIRDALNKYHFKTKDDHRVNIEYKDEHFFLSLFKWGTETSFQIDLDAVLSTQHKFLETENKIEVETPDSILRVYPIDTRTTGAFYGESIDIIQCHDGGLRFEIVFKKKRPAMDNSFSFPIVAKNLRFSYQPFLTQEEIDAGVIRSFNVEGSYAVYHASKRDNQYMTGKAFHIYRPIAEDALGVKAWCSIHIDKYLDPTSLTLTIPQQFLDEATYPITIDPDFGYTSIGGTNYILAITNGTPNEFRRGSAWAMPAPGGTANYLRAYIGASAGTPTVDCKAFINEKDSGGAGTHAQIATDENLACAAAFHWEEFTLGGEALTQSVDYILNIVGNTSDCAKGESYAVKGDENGAVASYREDFPNYAAPANPWVVAAEGTTIDYSIYCNYSEPVVGGGLRMILGLKGHMGYDLRTRGGKARRRMW